MAARTRSDTQPLRVLGFPVTISPGFVLGLLLVLAINSRNPAFALRLCVALAVFTLVHELGHALAARRFGADTSISLNFLVGWASMSPRRPLTPLERAIISVAGPGVQIALGVGILAVLGANPLDFDAMRSDSLRLAIWWAAPVLGAANLLPLNPLDGGAVAAIGLDTVVPGRGRAIVQWWTVAICAVAVVAVVVSPAWRPWALTVAFFTFWNVQGLGAMRRRGGGHPSADAARALGVAVSAERSAWATGRPGLFPPGFGPSPWFRAHVLVQAGRLDTARGLLVQALERGGGRWAPPEGATVAQMRPLVALVPEPAPVDDAYAAAVFQRILHDTGDLRRSAEYGARAYEAHPAPTIAHAVARSLALLGHADAAMGWLASAEPGLSVAPLDADTDLDSLRMRPDFQALRAAVAARPTA